MARGSVYAKTRRQLAHNAGFRRHVTLGQTLNQVEDGGTRARVVIVDDHLLTRAGLRAVIADDSDFEVVGEASTGAQAVAVNRALRPDLVLMDLRMPEMDGL